MSYQMTDEEIFSAAANESWSETTWNDEKLGWMKNGL
jgi:hypothetical protein